MLSIAQLFSHKLTVEDRSPIHLFGSLAVLPPKLEFWVQLMVLLSMQMMISALFAVVVYKFVVSRSETEPASYLVGFGFVIPLALYVPFYLLQALDLQSRTLAMALICLPILVTLRCMEAMFRFVPPAAGKSLKNYVIYYSSTMETQFDEKQEAVKATTEDVVRRIFEFGGLFVVLSVLFSITSPYDFAPFATRFDAHSIDHGLLDLFHPFHLANNFIAAVLVSVSLSFSTLGASLLFNVSTGIMTRRVVENPMFASKTPSEFWGRKWNNLVHSLLKKGIYKPVRQLTSSSKAAIFSAFVVSGLLHEYVWAILFYVHEHQVDAALGKCRDCFYPIYGKQMVFFGLNGVTIALESMIGGWCLFQWMKRSLPGFLITVLVLMTALPYGHLFTGDWIIGDYFSHFMLGFPVLVRLELE